MSQAKSSSGRETSFGLPTSGYKGWIPVLLKDGSHSKREPQEGYKNAVDNREYIPPGGWNDPPPCPTGELNTHTSPLYRKNYDAIRWDTEEEITEEAKCRYNSLVKAGLIHPEEADHAGSQ